MKNSQNVKDLKKELNFLYKVTSKVHSLEIEQLLKEIVDIAIDVTSGDSCLIYILDKNKNELILRASKNPHPDLLQKIKMRLGEGITGWVAKENKLVAIGQGAARDLRFKYFRSLPEDLFEAFISVPIATKNQVIGVINVQHKFKHTHSQMEINLFAAIGKLVGTAVENAILVEESEELKESLETRKFVEKAKGIIMKKSDLTENQAYSRLRTLSMKSRKSLKEIAEAIILADKINIEFTP